MIGANQWTGRPNRVMPAEERRSRASFDILDRTCSCNWHLLAIAIHFFPIGSHWTVIWEVLRWNQINIYPMLRISVSVVHYGWNWRLFELSPWLPSLVRNTLSSLWSEDYSPLGIVYNSRYYSTIVFCVQRRWPKDSLFCKKGKMLILTVLFLPWNCSVRGCWWQKLKGIFRGNRVVNWRALGEYNLSHTISELGKSILMFGFRAFCLLQQIFWSS